MRKATLTKGSNRRARAGKIKQQFPRGWDEKRVRAVIAHYENQTEDEQAAEIEAALAAPGQTLVAVPTELVPAVHRLIARHGRQR